MSFTLITGPANAAKAGAVLERLRRAIDREPLLVVPTAADVDHYRRELAAGGVVFGAEVLTFSRLVREIAARAGVGARPLGRVACERIVRATVDAARGPALARSAASPGFAAAAAALFGELQRAAVTPARFTVALRAWAADGGEEGREAYASELAALYSGYRARLETLGRADPDGFAWAALDALRAAPASWGDRPVLFYGFDDLTAAELDAVETLVRRTAAEVVLALPHEAGRAAFAGTAGVVQTLLPLADEHLELPDRADHYAPAARPALHHLERGLFEPATERVAPNGAVRLLEAGGERAEAELVGAEVLELMREGVEPEDIAVLVRGPSHALFDHVLTGYGVPVAAAGRLPLARTRLGAGVLAFARAALGGGTARDLLAWLRTPGKREAPDAVDALEAAVRRTGITGAAQARAAWERDGGRPLVELDALTDAAAEGPVAFAEALAAEAQATWTAPHRRAAAVLGDGDREDAAAAAELRAAVGELRGLAAADPALAGGAEDVLKALEGVRVRRASGARAGVLLADPLAIRARRFRAVFVCGLQEGEFPRVGTPEPFLDDDERRALARASGLVLAPHENAVERERGLFYACVSRPEEVVFLSFRSAGEEGDPLQPSVFLDDVRALFTPALDEQRGRRLLADVTWEPREAPTPLELRRALAVQSPGAEPGPLAPPATGAVLGVLAGRRREAARGVETFAACGVRWLVEQLLAPARPDPDPDPMRRGAAAHRVLERTLEGLRARAGRVGLDASTLPAAEAELARALDATLGRPRDGRARAERRALEVDLRRVLAHEAACGPGVPPERLEWSFGGERDGEPALALDGIEITGRVDRLDVDRAAGTALVRDYKHRTVHPQARWEQDGALQVGLYLLAARALLGLEPVAGLYQPLGGRELTARGLVRDDAPEAAFKANDVLDPAAFELVLSATRERAERAAADLHAGRVRPCPSRCTPKGCAYPAICRAAEGDSADPDAVPEEAA